MKIQLVEIDEGSQEPLPTLFQDYVLEMCQYLDPEDAEKQSLNAAAILQRYWQNKHRWAYLIMADRQIAGFCLLRVYPQETDTFDIDQFFVTTRFRRRGIGRVALLELVRKHPGRWLIRVLKTNSKALAFWLDVVTEVSDGDYQLTADQVDMDFVRFCTRTRQSARVD
ncbi:MAG: GNAT family N-acetyltransferase [Gammaproteobacteria bacterium]|nr:GNAT family N-acetyltransferase [Pseudomonadales bacterium]MCP5348577.1 GNAT family N-acetyltransferase [Pseudomonadales bacterium]